MMNTYTDDKQEEEIEKSYLVIEFAAPSSTMVSIRPYNVTPGQMIFIGEYLRVHGIRAMEQQILQHEEEEREKKLAIPRPEILVPR